MDTQLKPRAELSCRTLSSKVVQFNVNYNRLVLAVFSFSLLGFSVSAVVHFSTVLGLNFFANSNLTYFLHVLLFIPFGTMILDAKKEFGEVEKSKLYDLVRSTPDLMKLLVFMVVLYALGNFFYSVLHLMEGSPSLRGGSYIVENRGELIREITLEEYEKLKRLEIRAFSGHWLIFFLMPTAYFYLKPAFKNRLNR